MRWNDFIKEAIGMSLQELGRWVGLLRTGYFGCQSFTGLPADGVNSTAPNIHTHTHF